MQVQLSLKTVNSIMSTSNGINLLSMSAPHQGDCTLIYIPEVQNKWHSRLIKQNIHQALVSVARHRENSRSMYLLAQYPDSQFL